MSIFLTNQCRIESEKWCLATHWQEREGGGPLVPPELPPIPPAVSRVDSSGVELRNPALTTATSSAVAQLPFVRRRDRRRIAFSIRLARRGLRHVHEQVREREDVPHQASGLTGLCGIREFAEKQEDPYQTVPMLHLRHFDVSSFIIIFYRFIYRFIRKRWREQVFLLFNQMNYRKSGIRVRLSLFRLQRFAILKDSFLDYFFNWKEHRERKRLVFLLLKR